MISKKSFELVRLSVAFRLIRQLPGLGHLLRVAVEPGEEESKGFKLNSNLEYLLSVFHAQLGHLGAGERGTLNESLVLQLDQCLSYQSLSDAKLLGNLTFDDLFTAPDDPGDNRFL